MHNRIKKLAELNRNAKTTEEKKRIHSEMRKLEYENPHQYKSALEKLIKETSKCVDNSR